MNHEQIGKNLNHSDSRFAHDEQFRLRLLPCTNKYAYVISSSSERAQLLPPDAIGKLISLNGHKLRLKPVLQVSDTMIMGDSVKLQNATTGEELFSFPLKAAPYFRAKKIAADTGEEFLLVQSGSVGVTDSICSGIWVVGLHKGKYVSFINIDTVRKTGLLFGDIS